MSATAISTLRSLLKRTNLTTPAIQGAAGAMMKHYDKSAGLAVTEWRNALQQAREDQYLPLLYVANEVLQNSKRNRGNKFLEAFSPILGQALIFISQRSSAATVDKIRRTIKIWGDRRVFSVRFVNELLKGLEPYRSGGTNTTIAVVTTPTTTSPPPFPSSSPAAISAASMPESDTPVLNSNEDLDQDLDQDLHVNNDDDDDDQEDEDNAAAADANDDDDDDLFGNATHRLLNIDIDLDQAAAEITSIKKRRRSDTRRSSDGGANSSSLSTGTNHPTKSKRRAVQSTSSLMELWNQVSSLQMNYDRVQGALKEIDKPQFLDEGAVQEKVDMLVGDELLNAYKKTIQHEEDIVKHRKELYDIAQRRKALELEAVRYLPWLENALKQDDEDIQFCEKYSGQLVLFQHVHKPAKTARDGRLKEEEDRRIQEEEMKKKREEEEERKKFMESAMAKQTEAQPGMVWNKATGEYQFLNQDETWRD
jgi:hypothetical protein